MLYHAEVVETVTRRVIYAVDAKGPKQAQTKAEAGETDWERPVNYSDEIINRSVLVVQKAPGPTGKAR